MKKTRLFALALSVAVSCSVFLTAGCSKVNELADKAEGTASKIGNDIMNFEDRITGGLSEEAQTLDSAAKTFYSGVISGEINETNSGYLVTAPLPDPGATVAEKKKAAKSLTILSVLEWQGMTSRYSSDVLSKLVFSEGSIRPASSASGKTISEDTTLGELFE